MTEATFQSPPGPRPSGRRTIRHRRTRWLACARAAHAMDTRGTCDAGPSVGGHATRVAYMGTRHALVCRLGLRRAATRSAGPGSAFEEPARGLAWCQIKVPDQSGATNHWKCRGLAWCPRRRSGEPRTRPYDGTAGRPSPVRGFEVLRRRRLECRIRAGRPRRASSPGSLQVPVALAGPRRP
jgi:hypothetical protein